MVIELQHLQKQGIISNSYLELRRAWELFYYRALPKFKFFLQQNQ